MTIRISTLSTDTMTVEVGDVLDFVIFDQWISGYNDNAQTNFTSPDAVGVLDSIGSTAPVSPIDKYQVYSTVDGGAAVLLMTNDDGLGSGGGGYADDFGSDSERTLNPMTVAGQTIYKPEVDEQYTVTEVDFPLSGQTGIIVAYDTSNETDQYIIPFRVVYNKFLHQVADASVDTEAPNSIMGRLLTCERNQTDLILPRLRRALGLLGEHQKVDGFLYDDDGNITECRIRIFRDNAGANGASLWTDRVNDADPASAMDAGNFELYRYTVTATNLLPRNLRTGYSQVIGINEADEEADNVYGSDGSASGTDNGSVL